MAHAAEATKRSIKKNKKNNVFILQTKMYLYQSLIQT